MSEQNTATSPKSQSNNRLAEVAGLFLRLGFTAFGGPAAHIAMMRREIVQRRQWISDERFIDLLSVVNLVPGPNSTELAIYLGYLRAGWPGLILAGICFIGPAMLIVLALAWLYVRYGTLPVARELFYGIQPVVIAIIAQALWGLSRTVLKGILPIILAVLAVIAYLLNVNQLILLVVGGIIFGVVRWLERRNKQNKPPEEKKTFINSVLPVLPFAFGLSNLRATWRTISAIPLATVVVAAAVPVSLLTLFLTFLKIGSVLYGSGYVLLAFLRADFVQSLGWLTEQQLLDAVSIGQFTPGPVFTTATFIGYLVAGLPGALLATLGIFLPSFVFIAIIHPLATKLRSTPWTAAILDGINVVALALMAGVLVQLARTTLLTPFDLLKWLIALASLLVLLRFKINSAWLILAGAVVGLLHFWL
jgi:chromate transporter